MIGRVPRAVSQPDGDRATPGEISDTAGAMF